MEDRHGPTLLRLVRFLHKREEVPRPSAAMCEDGSVLRQAEAVGPYDGGQVPGHQRSDWYCPPVAAIGGSVGFGRFLAGFQLQGAD